MDEGRDVKNKILGYEFQIAILEDADDSYLRKLFLRLQIGLLLITGEKLNASTGRMKKFVFEKLAQLDFLQNLGIPNRRFARETLCAQIAINSFEREDSGEFARTRYEDLEAFFNHFSNPKGKDLQLFEKKSKIIEDTLEYLWEIFEEKSADIRNRSFALTIYLFVEENRDIIEEAGVAKFRSFTFSLWKRLREESKKGMDRTNRELYEFQNMLSSAPGEEYQISRRHSKFEDYFAHFSKTGKIYGD